jgi:hypothetical protein
MIILDNEEYLTIQEACEMLKITSQTLRTRTKALNIPKYHQKIAPNVVYYKKSDLEDMRAMRPVREEEEENNGQ